jgi:3-methyladenine DNA glycosylase AlkD
VTTMDEATARLDSLLAAASDAKTREFWERYLKGTARFRGVPMAAIRASIHTVWLEAHLQTWATSDLLALADRWFREPLSEDKLAATLLIAERIGDRLTLTHVDALARPLAEGHIADWGVCDWYATKALHGFVAGGGSELQARAEAIAAWSTTPSLWQRRAAVVAFVKLAGKTPQPFADFTDLLLDACAANLVSDDRFAHTGPGWLLRELSRVEPDRVSQFVWEHPTLSREAVRMATARLRPGPYRRR